MYSRFTLLLPYKTRCMYISRSFFITKQETYKHPCILHLDANSARDSSQRRATRILDPKCPRHRSRMLTIPRFGRACVAEGCRKIVIKLGNTTVPAVFRGRRIMGSPCTSGSSIGIIVFPPLPNGRNGSARSSVRTLIMFLVRERRSENVLTKCELCTNHNARLALSARCHRAFLRDAALRPVCEGSGCWNAFSRATYRSSSYMPMPGTINARSWLRAFFISRGSLGIPFEGHPLRAEVPSLCFLLVLSLEIHMIHRNGYGFIQSNR